MGREEKKEQGIKRRKTPKEKTITGYVTAIDCDLSETVSTISIEVDGEEVVVEAVGLRKELLDLLDEEIEVTGAVRVPVMVTVTPGRALPSVSTTVP